MRWNLIIHEIFFELQRPLQMVELFAEVEKRNPELGELTKEEKNSFRVKVCLFKKAGELKYIKPDGLDGFYYLNYWEEQGDCINGRSLNHLKRQYE